MRVFYIYVLFSCSFLQLHARKALDSLQEIHKAVGTSLLSIRKNYPDSQQQVYTTIDQVSKLCDLSKKQYYKRKSLKEALLVEKKKHEVVLEKVERISQKVLDLQQQVAEKDQKILALLRKESVASDVQAPVVSSPALVASPLVREQETQEVLREALQDVEKKVNEVAKADA